MKRGLSFVVLVLTIAFIVPPPSAQAWWRDAVFYQIFVRSYLDSDDDGTGDFNGVTARLDYLQALGVTAIWLMPVNPSPSYHGYDVTDYHAVNPQYGTMADFERLIAGAHRRGMRVVVDLVLNHTSSQHPWFQSANASVESPRRHWYRWANEFRGEHWHGGSEGFYYGMFWSEMPDLNYHNPDVTDEMKTMSLYWLEDVGVDGFRLDAAKHFIEDDDNVDGAVANHEWLRSYYAAIKDRVPGAYLLGEIWEADSSETARYAGGLDQIFNFELARKTLDSVGRRSRSGIHDALAAAIRNNPDGDFATFLRNHDQERVMTMLHRNIDHAKLAAFLLLTSPGTPFLYYGEEIGMTGNKPDEMIRTPMQWNTNQYAGFSRGSPWMAVNDDYRAGITVADQVKDPESLLHHYRKLIQLRKAHRALRTGRTVLVETGNDAVWAMVRVDRDETLLILANLSEHPVSDYQIRVADDAMKGGVYEPVVLFGKSGISPLSVLEVDWVDDRSRPVLPGHQMVVLKIR